MQLEPVLAKATRLLKQKKFREAIRLLEPKVTLYRDSFRYRSILAMAYLYSGDYGSAFTYFKLARDIKMRDPSVLLGFAVLYLRRGETDRAIDLYLEVQDIDEANKTADKALKLIKKYSRSDTLSDWIESGRYTGLFPPMSRLPFSPASVLVTVVCALAAFVLVFGVLAGLKAVNLPFKLSLKLSPFQSGIERNGFVGSVLDQSARENPVQTGGSYRYILTRSQVLTMYQDARELFNTHHDERAKVILNRIIESNAVDSIKTRADILISYMDVPGFDTLKDKIAYRDVKKDPLLYRDCYVVWKGMAANLQADQNSTVFEFLVGYDTRSMLEGIVLVSFNFSVAVNPEKPLEILGKIVPLEDGSDITIEGTAVHQSGILGGK